MRLLARTTTTVVAAAWLLGLLCFVAGLDTTERCPNTGWVCANCTAMERGDLTNCTCQANWDSACTNCDNQHFGPQCNRTCRSCKNGGTCISGVDGTGTCACPGKFAGDDCSVCVTGFYGANCSYLCADCHHGTCVNTVTSQGECRCDSEGFDPVVRCAACRANYYGQNCTACVDCGHGVCADGLSSDGKCVCEEGWQGNHCNTPDGYKRTVVVWVIVAGLVLAVAVFAFSAAHQGYQVVPPTDGFCFLTLVWLGFCASGSVRCLGLILDILSSASTVRMAQATVKRLVVYDDLPYLIFASTMSFFLSRLYTMLMDNLQDSRNIWATSLAAGGSQAASHVTPVSSRASGAQGHSYSEISSAVGVQPWYKAVCNSILCCCCLGVHNRVTDGSLMRAGAWVLAVQRVLLAVAAFLIVVGVVVLVSLAERETDSRLRPVHLVLDIYWIVVFSTLWSLAMICLSGLKLAGDSILPSGCLDRRRLVGALRGFVALLTVMMCVMCIVAVRRQAVITTPMLRLSSLATAVSVIRVSLMFVLMPGFLMYKLRLRGSAHHVGAKSRACIVDFRLLKLRKRPVAAGTSGRVYFGTYAGAEVAVKAQRVNDLNDLHQVTNEAMFLMKLVHPHIVRFHAISLKRPYCYTITERCDMSLQQLIANNAVPEGAEVEGGRNSEGVAGKPLQPPPKRFRWEDIALQISMGMEFVHSVGVIHRDLKPANVLISGGIVKICDLGTAKLSSSRRNTARLGTPAYMAPELFVGQAEAEYSSAVDVYSFGIILWALVTCRDPFADQDTSSNWELLRKVKAGLRPPRTVEISDAAWELMTQCWHENPSARPTFVEITRTLKLQTQRQDDDDELEDDYDYDYDFDAA